MAIGGNTAPQRGLALAGGLVCALASAGLAGTLAAQDLPVDIQTDASASLLQPLAIMAAQPLEFGTLAIPQNGECIYEIDVAGRANAPGGICQFIGGDRFPARFTLSCAANSLVQFQVIHTDSAPAGAVFAAPSGAMDIDGSGAGPAFQTRPCDGDGTSDIAAAGRLTVSAGATHGFTGPVGTIRLEVAYD
jgi:hypothetical protein